MCYENIENMTKVLVVCESQIEIMHILLWEYGELAADVFLSQVFLMKYTEQNSKLSKKGGFGFKIERN